MYTYNGPGAVVKHKSRRDVTMLVTGRNNDHQGHDDLIKCKYWDEAKGKFIYKEFYDFELEEKETKNGNLRKLFLPGDAVKYIATPDFEMVILTTKNTGVSFTCSFWNPVKLEFEQDEFYGYEITAI